MFVEGGLSERADVHSEPRMSRKHKHHGHHHRSKTAGLAEVDEEAAAALAAAIAQIDVERLPPRPVVPSERRSRWSSRKALLPISPHQLIDGRVIRSALLINRKRVKERALRFPEDEVAGCLEPENPWRLRQDIKREAVIAAYKEACAKHKVFEIHSLIFQLKTTENLTDRCEEISFKGLSLKKNDCEALEEIFRRILFYKVDLDGAIAEDESADVLFQIFEFYEAISHLVLSNNQMIGTLGWQSCSRMLRKTESLKQLDAVNVHLTEEYMTIMTRGLRYSYLIILRFDSCKLNGRLLELLVIALKFNMALRQLYLCDNELQRLDCYQLEILLKFNSRISILDLSNNLIDDDGIGMVLNGLTHQLHFGMYSKSKKGLECLVLWNNKLTRKSGPHFNAAIEASKTLKFLNVGMNDLTDDVLMAIRENLAKNNVLVKLDFRATQITCFGLGELATALEDNITIEALDVRDNAISKTGLESLVEVMKVNTTVTEIKVDEKPKPRTAAKVKAKYAELAKKLQTLCDRNKELAREVEKKTESNDDEDSDENDSIYGEDELYSLQEPQEELPSQYKRYMSWKI